MRVSLGEHTVWKATRISIFSAKYILALKLDPSPFSSWFYGTQSIWSPESARRCSCCHLHDKLGSGGPAAHRCPWIVTEFQSSLGCLQPCESDISGKGNRLKPSGPSLYSLAHWKLSPQMQRKQGRDGTPRRPRAEPVGVCGSPHVSPSICGVGLSRMELCLLFSVIRPPYPQSLPLPLSVLAF